MSPFIENNMTDDEMRSMLDLMPVQEVYVKTALTREEAIALLKDEATETHIEEMLDTYESHREDILKDTLQSDIEKAEANLRKVLTKNGEEDDLESYRYGGYSSRGRYYQSDWDTLYLARDRGFLPSRSYESCRHDKTDGSVDCPDCGKTVSAFIDECTHFLDYLT